MQNKTDILHTEFHFRIAVSCGLYAMLFILFLNQDIWALRGALEGDLGLWVQNKGGENALWMFSIIYSSIAVLAFATTLFGGRWIRWLTFSCVLFLSLYFLLGIVEGFAEFGKLGWYFFYLLSLIDIVAFTLTWLTFKWARFNGPLVER